LTSRPERAKIIVAAGEVAEPSAARRQV